MIDKKDFFKIGIGTWGIGGFAQKNPHNDDAKQINALSHMFKQGFNFIELNFWTGSGHSIEIISKALEQSGISRDEIFISQAVYSYTAKSLSDVESELLDMQKVFNSDYIDVFSVNPAGIVEFGEKNVFDLYHKLLSENKIRYINLNNPSLSTLKRNHKEFENKLFSIEVGFNFEVRENEKLGIIPYAVQNNILPIIYQPLRRNRTAARDWPLLVELSKKYQLTQNQIILQWIVSKGFLPITKSENISHINEHLATFKVSVDPSDLDRIDSFTPDEYTPPQIDWDGSGNGVAIDQLSNVFDENYPVGGKV